MSLKNIVLGIAIIILTISAVVYGVNTFYDAPQYEDYCGQKSLGPVETQAQCYAVGGKWNGFESEMERLETAKSGWCDVEYECRAEYDSAREIYHKNLFLITLPLGILLIIGGVLVFGLEAVGAGIGGGGIGVVLWGVLGYWEFGSDLLRFALSLIGLIIVIIATYWFNDKLKFGKKFLKK